MSMNDAELYVGKVVKTEEDNLLEIALDFNIAEKMEYEEGDTLVFIPKKEDGIMIIRRIPKEEISKLSQEI